MYLSLQRIYNQTKNTTKMKKTLLMAALFAATTCNAQTIIWNGEDKELGSDGGFWNRADPTVVEEDGSKCLWKTTFTTTSAQKSSMRTVARPSRASSIHATTVRCMAT